MGKKLPYCKQELVKKITYVVCLHLPNNKYIKEKNIFLEQDRGKKNCIFDGNPEKMLNAGS